MVFCRFSACYRTEHEFGEFHHDDEGSIRFSEVELSIRVSMGSLMKFAPDAVQYTEGL
jgi:hypothetical protein